MQHSYTVIGLMSGTSLDGLDIACCKFTRNKDAWKFTIHEAVTYEYSDDWKRALKEVEKKTALELALLHTRYGHFTGALVQNFITEYQLQPDFIAAHGHTIFHQPDNKLTVQIGSGAAIAAETGLPVVCDFRTTDVALGGQGAPLVPVGDKLLFGTYDGCINLGGFANISFDKQNKRIAFDICPLNIVLNFLCESLQLSYDDKGSISRSGTINQQLLAALNQLEFYHQDYPKSLGKEWVLKNFIPVMNAFNISVADKLRTVTEHMAIQIVSAINTITGSNMQLLVTGGGAFNTFLIERINALTNHKLVIPDEKLINYKEALIFAFLGLRRWLNQPNALNSVTGAKRDSTGGCIYWY